MAKAQSVESLHVDVSIEVNSKNWQRFLKVPEAVRRAYLSRVVDDAVVEILDKNFDMLQWYMANYAEKLT